MATRKRPVTKKARQRLIKRPRAAVALALLAVVFVVGILSAYKAGQNHQAGQSWIASGKQLEAARTDITNEYLAVSSTGCADPSDPINPADRVAVFYKYLRVNAHADRAVIRGCNDADTLLAYQAGKWLRTEVNMNLDARANPAWQKVCDITDITVADTKARPENSAIDAGNLQMCKALQQGKNIDIFGKEIKE